MEPRSFNLNPRLKEARKNCVPAISSAELGRRLAPELPDFKATHVAAMELGYRHATWPEVEALARTLNVDAHWLANRTRPAPAVPRAASFVVPPATLPKPKPLVVPIVTKPAAPVAPPPPPPPPPDLAPTDIPVLVPGEEVQFRRQMSEELERTLVKLGDTKLTPFEWRSWREFEKRLRAAAVGRVVLRD